MAILLAGLHRLTGTAIPALGSLVFGLALYALAVLLLVGAARHGRLPEGVLGATLLLPWSQVWVSHGAGAPLFLSLLVAAATHLEAGAGSRRGAVAGALAGLAVWVRPAAWRSGAGAASRASCWPPSPPWWPPPTHCSRWGSSPGTSCPWRWPSSTASPSPPASPPAGPPARSGSGTLPAGPSVAALEIGVLGYHSHRPLGGLMGLVSPESPPHVARRDLPGALREQDADLFVALSRGRTRRLVAAPWFRESYEQAIRFPVPHGRAWVGLPAPRALTRGLGRGTINGPPGTGAG